jgi:hypothetical protein
MQKVHSSSIIKFVPRAASESSHEGQKTYEKSAFGLSRHETKIIHNAGYSEATSVKACTVGMDF